MPEGDTAAVSQFYEIDAANAVGTPIGSPVVERHLIALDVDATGHGFALGTGSPSEPKLQLLFRVDVVTGTVSDPIPLDFPLDVGQCFDVDLLPDGALLATCEGLDAANAPTTWVSLVDTATGTFTHDPHHPGRGGRPALPRHRHEPGHPRDVGVLRAGAARRTASSSTSTASSGR